MKKLLFSVFLGCSAITTSASADDPLSQAITQTLVEGTCTQYF